LAAARIFYRWSEARDEENINMTRIKTKKAEKSPKVWDPGVRDNAEAA